MARQSTLAPLSAPALGPPRISALVAMSKRVFGTPVNAVFSIILLGALAAIAPRLFRWAVLDSVWGHATALECQRAAGACWSFVQVKARLILFGRFPYEEQWRPLLATVLLIAALAVTANWNFWRRQHWAQELTVAWLLVIGAIGLLMGGGALGLAEVESERWGGLPLTLMLATVGIAVAFVLAIGLALGRRSEMPVIRILSISYIELIRGVPLISILFMAAVVLPIILPGDMVFSKLSRAQIAFSLFFAAYLAEVIRGGLQAIPRGQFEAAKALGLGHWQTMRLVVLPQALTLTIPSQVNIFISAFKDTSLVVVIGMHDLLGTTTAAINDPAWMGFYVEAYLFTAAIYLICCALISAYSQRLETHLNQSIRH